MDLRGYVRKVYDVYGVVDYESAMELHKRIMERTITVAKNLATGWSLIQEYYNM